MPEPALPEDALKRKAEELQEIVRTYMRLKIGNQRELATKTGLLPSTISEMMTGRVPWDLKKLAFVCYALDLDPVDALVTGRDIWLRDKEVSRSQRYQEMLDERDESAIISLAQDLPAERRRAIVEALAEDDVFGVEDDVSGVEEVRKAG